MPTTAGMRGLGSFGFGVSWALSLDDSAGYLGKGLLTPIILLFQDMLQQFKTVQGILPSDSLGVRAGITYADRSRSRRVHD